jgi:hypothetical protein
VDREMLEEEGIMNRSTDTYMLRVQAQTDPVVRRAQERILRAARAVFDATDQLHFALMELERHPDYVKTERAKRKGKALEASLTPAWWIHEGIRSVLQDATLQDASSWLFEDSNPRRLASSLRLFVDTEKRDVAAFVRRRPAKRKEAGLVVVPQAA